MAGSEDSSQGTGDEVTRLLRLIREGDGQAMHRLIPVVYQELRKQARLLMRRERADHTLQPTALVHEAFRRLAAQQADWVNRKHFFGIATEVMRRILIDYARARLAAKRQGDVTRVSLDDTVTRPWTTLESERMLSLNERLDKLREIDPRKCQVVELRFFGGLTEEEIAKHLQVSTKTVKRDWQVARAWLQSQL